ncbi:DUF692 family protein [Bacillus licheniformis]|nr:DUF692 family protein [Bacillus licheniformis]
MLLDVSNLYINSINHKYDPYAFLISYLKINKLFTRSWIYQK